MCNKKGGYLHPDKCIEDDGKVLRGRIAEVPVTPTFNVKQNLTVENQEEDHKELVERLAWRSEQTCRQSKQQTNNVAHHDLRDERLATRVRLALQQRRSGSLKERDKQQTS
jgi:hypothetical protein